jgi:hypothetical protein
MAAGDERIDGHPLALARPAATVRPAMQSGKSSRLTNMSEWSREITTTLCRPRECRRLDVANALVPPSVTSGAPLSAHTRRSDVAARIP